MDREQGIGVSPDGAGLSPFGSNQPVAVSPVPASVPDAVCEACADPEDGSSWYPMYGVAPHECYWRKGPEFTLGQSTLLPFGPDDCFVPDLGPRETWADFKYPQACGVFYCPECQADQYRAAWAKLVARIGEPPAIAIEAGTAETERLSPQGESAGSEGVSPINQRLTEGGA